MKYTLIQYLGSLGSLNQSPNTNAKYIPKQWPQRPYLSFIAMHGDRYHLGRINHEAPPDQSQGTETSLGVQFHNECKTKCLVNSILKTIYIKNPPFSKEIFSSLSVPLGANIEAGGSCYDNGFMYMKPLDEKALAMS